MSNADRTRLSFVAESTWGVTPATPTMQRLRFTSEDFKQETSTTDSAEIREDRQVQDVIRTSISAMGGFSFEFSAGTIDEFIRAQLEAAAWSSAVTITATTISAAAADNSYNDSGSGFGSVVAGQWIRVTGFATAANNGFSKIVSKTTAKIVVTGKVLVNESATPSVTIKMGAQVVNGVAPSSFTIERKHMDVTLRSAWRGMTPEGLDMELSAEKIVTGKISFVGSAETVEASDVGSVYTAPTTTTILNAVDHAVAVISSESGTLAAVPCNTFSFKCTNNLRARRDIGDRSPSSLGHGDFQSDGSFKAYLNNQTLNQKYLNFDDVSLAFVLQDAASNAYVFEWPSVKISANAQNASGKQSDIFKEASWRAKASTTEGITMRVVRF